MICNNKKEKGEIILRKYKVIFLLSLLIFSGCICCKTRSQIITEPLAEDIQGLDEVEEISPFGVFNDLYINDEGEVSLKDAVELGNMRTRLVCHWALVEPVKGRLDFSAMDKVINYHYDAGISPLITVKCVSPWGTRKSGNVKTFIGSPPKDYEEYNNFLRELVKRYKDKVDYWQIENEVFDNTYGPVVFWDGTKEEYIELLKNSYKTIKEEDPEAKVVLAGFANLMFNEINEFHPTGFVEKEKVEIFFYYIMKESEDWCDAVDFHQYYYPDIIYSEVKLLKDAMEKYGYEKEIICTEAGDFDVRLFRIHLYTDEKIPIVEKFLSLPSVKSEVERVLQWGVSPGEFTDFAIFLKENEESGPLLEKYQAENLVKRICITLSLGVSQIYPAWMRDQKKPVNWYFAHIALTDTDGRKKPHYYTYKILIDKLEGFKSLEEFKKDSEEKIIKFTFEDKNPIFVIWNDGEEKEIDFSPYINTSEVKITHIITDRDKTDKDVKIEVVPANSVNTGITPIFLE